MVGGGEVNLEPVITGLVVTVVGGIIAGILIFLVRHFISQRTEKKKEQDSKLRTHFEDINKGVINRISEMARSLCVRNERLVTSYAPISKSYDFEKQETYKGFELHFPEMAQEWEHLNNKAVQLIGVLERWKAQEANVEKLEKIEEHGARRGLIPDEKFNGRLEKEVQIYEKIYLEFNHSLGHLQREFGDFAKRLADKVNSIDKYQMGKVFKYNKKCPTCQKF